MIYTLCPTYAISGQKIVNILLSKLFFNFLSFPSSFFFFFFSFLSILLLQDNTVSCRRHLHLSMSVSFSGLLHIPIRDVGAAGKPCVSEITHLEVNPSVKRVLNARTDRSIRVWKVTPQGLSQPVVIESAHARGTSDILWNKSTDTSFASVGRAASVKLWNCSGHLEREFRVAKPGGAAELELIEYSTDGKYMCVVDSDGTVLVHAVRNNYKLVAHFQVSDHVNDIKWTNSGHQYLLAALDNGTAEILHLDEDQALLHRVNTLRGHKSAVTCIAFDPRGRFFALGTAEGTVSLWSTEDMLNFRVLGSSDEKVVGIDIHRDGTHIAVAFDRGNVRIFQSDTYQEVHELPKSTAGKNGIPGLKWFPTRGSFVYISDDGRSMTMARRDL